MVIDAPRPDEWIDPDGAPAAQVARQDDLRSVGGPFDGVKTDDGWPINGGESSWGLIGSKPPDFKLVAPGNCVHRNDGAQAGGRGSVAKRIDVSVDIEEGAGGLLDVSGRVRIADGGPNFTIGRINPLPDLDCLANNPRRGVGIVPSDSLVGGIPAAQARGDRISKVRGSE